MYVKNHRAVDFSPEFQYNFFVAEQISLRGAGHFRLRLDDWRPDP